MRSRPKTWRTWVVHSNDAALIYGGSLHVRLIYLGVVPARDCECSPLMYHANAELVTPDFAALGWKHPGESAQLWVGLIVEAALVELRAGRRQHRLRIAVDEYITHGR